MCRSSLFYFSKNLTAGPPQQTCIMEFKEYVDENSKGFGMFSFVGSLICLWLWILHFGLYCRSPRKDETAEEIPQGRMSVHERPYDPSPNIDVQPAQQVEMQNLDTEENNAGNQSQHFDAVDKEN
mmetsp:Transcript_9/g.18  ORF Transcript_9/g.18 Transcript_9/m.18 type:complete len:125 (+) Transcript_9:1057-1431(+)